MSEEAKEQAVQEEPETPVAVEEEAVEEAKAPVSSKLQKIHNLSLFKFDQSCYENARSAAGHNCQAGASGKSK